MPSLALLILDSALRQAVAEQLKPHWPVRALAAVAEIASATEDALLIEDDALKTPLPDKRPPLLFTLGECETGEIDITESFAKPLRLGHLLTRLQLYLSAQRQTQDVVFQLGSWRFSPRSKRIERDDAAPQKLTEKESALLTYLAQATAPIPRDELLAEIWGYDGRIDTHTLETHIYHLRSVPDWRDLILVRQGTYQLNPALLKP